MERSIRGIGLIRTLFLVPIMTAPIVVALTWRAMFNNDAGWINYFLALVRPAARRSGWATRSWRCRW